MLNEPAADFADVLTPQRMTADDMDALASVLTPEHGPIAKRGDTPDLASSPMPSEHTPPPAPRSRLFRSETSNGGEGWGMWAAAAFGSPPGAMRASAALSALLGDAPDATANALPDDATVAVASALLGDAPDAASSMLLGGEPDVTLGAQMSDAPASAESVQLGDAPDAAMRAQLGNERATPLLSGAPGVSLSEMRAATSSNDALQAFLRRSTREMPGDMLAHDVLMTAEASQIARWFDTSIISTDKEDHIRIALAKIIAQRTPSKSDARVRAQGKPGAREDAPAAQRAASVRAPAAVRSTRGRASVASAARGGDGV